MIKYFFSISLIFAIFLLISCKNQSLIKKKIEKKGGISSPTIKINEILVKEYKKDLIAGELTVSTYNPNEFNIECMLDKCKIYFNYPIKEKKKKSEKIAEFYQKNFFTLKSKETEVTKIDFSVTQSFVSAILVNFLKNNNVQLSIDTRLKVKVKSFILPYHFKTNVSLKDISDNLFQNDQNQITNRSL